MLIFYFVAKPKTIKNNVYKQLNKNRIILRKIKRDNDQTL